MLTTSNKPQKIQTARYKTVYGVFDKMLEGVQVIDKKWQYHYVNNALVKQGKTTRKELLGCTMMEKYPGIENTEMFFNLRTCMEQRIPATMLNKFDFPDGSIGYFEMRMQPVPEGVLILSIDITEQKKLEEELLRFNKQLERTVEERTTELSNALDREKEMNELKSHFVSFASHEFKNPLSAMQMSLNILEEFNISPHKKEREKFHGYIRESITDMFQVVDGFLSLNKLEQGADYYKKERLNLPELITSEINKIESVFKKPQKIIYQHCGEHDVVSDKQILASIISNIVSNALKYSDKTVKVNTETSKHRIHIKVTDKGIGVPEEDQNSLFQKFFRGTNTEDTQGTGLGLHIVKQYTDLLEGKINFTSKVNKGTTVEVWLPIQH